MKKPDYASMFTLRADGLYMGYWRDLDKDGKPKGKRHAIYDRDPEALYNKIKAKETPGRVLFRPSSTLGRISTETPSRLAPG